MQNNKTLSPDNRVLYGDSLQPPEGYVFDAGVATTFSLDFETALAAPVSIALFSAENKDAVLSNPLALLEGAERIAGRLAIFTDAGHIHAKEQPHSRLSSLLEDVIVQVAAPNKGAFHPKMWALRYRSAQTGAPSLLRLLVLSRNITQDRSWDLALRIDGVVTRRPRSVNKPLVDLLRKLPDLALENLPKSTRLLVNQLAEDVRKTEWEVPEPFESIEFAVNGLKGKHWRPDTCARLGVISPFCDEDALNKLHDLVPASVSSKPILCSRPGQLATVPIETLEKFEVRVLDEMATGDDDEEPSADRLQGLHAKVFICERGWDTSVTVGSGNATRPALISNSNVELFSTLTGKRSRVGYLDEIMGDHGFGRLTRSFEPTELPDNPLHNKKAEAAVNEARHSIITDAKLHFWCKPADEGASVGYLWRVYLVPAKPIPLDNIASTYVWPITRGESHKKDVLEALRTGSEVDLGIMPLPDITRFMACQLSDVSGKASALFSIKLPSSGLPEGRHAAILRSVIDNKDKFIQYLRLLLSDMSDPFALAKAMQKNNSNGSWHTSPDDMPLLEEMVRALCKDRSQLIEIERLISRLEAGNSNSSDSPIPENFHKLWQSFHLILQDRDSVHE